MEEKRMGEGYCPSCLKTKENCICYKNIAIPLENKDCDTMISLNKACEWLEKWAYFSVNDLTGSLDEKDLVDRFRKAMKGW